MTNNISIWIHISDYEVRGCNYFSGTLVRFCCVVMCYWFIICIPRFYSNSTLSGGYSLICHNFFVCFPYILYLMFIFFSTWECIVSFAMITCVYDCTSTCFVFLPRISRSIFPICLLGWLTTVAEWGANMLRNCPSSLFLRKMFICWAWVCTFIGKTSCVNRETSEHMRY